MLDLGSGAGFDAFLAARAVGPEGRVIGVDMTAEMVAKARANAKKTGRTNTEFRLGEIEALPVTDAIVDVIISNCVIKPVPGQAAGLQRDRAWPGSGTMQGFAASPISRPVSTLRQRRGTPLRGSTWWRRAAHYLAGRDRVGEDCPLSRTAFLRNSLPAAQSLILVRVSAPS